MIKMKSNRLLVKPHKNSETSEGGIFTGRPETTFTQHADSDEQICMGEVVGVGPGKYDDETCQLIPMGVKKGQFIAFSDTCHRATGIDDLITLKNDDIMLISDKPFKHVEILY